LCSLPSDEVQEELPDVIDKSQVTVLTGATGCGKSIRIPLRLYEDLASKGEYRCVVVVVPHVLAARSLADKVARD